MRLRDDNACGLDNSVTGNECSSTSQIILVKCKNSTNGHTRYSITSLKLDTHAHTHTHTRLTAVFPGLPGWAGTRKVKPIWIVLKQETVSGSGISWAICKSGPRSRQITMPSTPPVSFYRPDDLPAVQPTASKHWKQSTEGKLWDNWTKFCTLV